MASRRWLAECARRAQWIRDGGLVAEEDVSQVDKRAHAVLAEINALGFVTADSQEGAARNRERAYVIGFLPKGTVPEFLAAVNRASGMVAWAHSPLPPGETGRQALPVTLDAKGNGVTWAHMLGTEEDIARETKFARLGRFRGSIAMVACVDAVWGRLAFRPGGLFPAVRDALASLG